METLNTLFSRKSIRDYTGEKISEDKLKEILKAAKAAPVGLGKYDTVRLTVIENPKLLQVIDTTAAKIFGNPDIHPLYGAPTLVVVSVKPENGSLNNVEFSNAAIMAHNIALAAVDFGIGCCHIWSAVMVLSANPDLVKRLELPDGYTPCCGIILGGTKEQYTMRDIPENRVEVNCLK